MIGVITIHGARETTGPGPNYAVVPKHPPTIEV